VSMILNIVFSVIQIFYKYLKFVVTFSFFLRCKFLLNFEIFYNHFYFSLLLLIFITSCYFLFFYMSFFFSPLILF
jgi:hypothetical protein